MAFNNDMCSCEIFFQIGMLRGKNRQKMTKILGQFTEQWSLAESILFFVSIQRGTI